MRKFGLSLLAAALISGACATDEPALVEPPDETAPATATPFDYDDRGTETFTSEPFEVELTLGDFYFEPTFIKSPGGATASIALKNEGSVPHTFTADALGINEELAPGTGKEIEVEIGTETRYEFFCRFHEGQGMRGAFQPH